MPYVKPEDRGTVYWPHMPNAGKLNYVLTMIIRGYMLQHGKNYETMNAIVGALESCKAEFQRRVVVPYENSKILANTDVYSKDETDAN